MLVPTRVSDVRLPREVIQLDVLKTNDGQPVSVGIEAVSETSYVTISRSLPGGNPKTAAMPGDIEPVVDQVADTLRALEASERIIERASFLIGDDGAEVRPAFWFTEEKAGAIPGRLLSDRDKVKLITGIARLSGVIDSPEVEHMTFPDEQ